LDVIILSVHILDGDSCRFEVKLFALLICAAKQTSQEFCGFGFAANQLKNPVVSK
jgi:hypothetical protein